MDGKKISFAFKSVQKPLLKSFQKPVKKDNEREIIEFLEEQSIKILGYVLLFIFLSLTRIKIKFKNVCRKEEKPEVLPVIPLKTDNNATRLRASMALKIIKEEQGIESIDESTAATEKIQNEVISIRPNETLEEKAAREILENLKVKKETNETLVFTLPLKPDELPLDGAVESTIDDYESIPIKDYGLAMLRGMGWKDEENKKGNKNTLVPVVRPKGMGLGADKATKPKALLIQPALNEILDMKVNAYVKVNNGKHSGYYGQVCTY